MRVLNIPMIFRVILSDHMQKSHFFSYTAIFSIISSNILVYKQAYINCNCSSCIYNYDVFNVRESPANKLTSLSRSRPRRPMPLNVPGSHGQGYAEHSSVSTALARIWAVH